MEEAHQTPQDNAPANSPDSCEHDTVGELIGVLEAHMTPLAEQSGRTEAAVQRLAGLVDRVDAFEQRLSIAFSDAQQTQDLLGQILEGLEAVRKGSEAGNAWSQQGQAALERLARWDESHDGKLANLLDQAESNANTVQRIREIIAALPEIATGQTEILDDLRQSVGTIEDRSEQTRAALATLAAEARETKPLFSELSCAFASCQETTTDLSATQKKMVDAINALNKRTTQLAEFAKQTAQAVRELADTNQATKQELRKSISEATGGLATKTTLSLILSAIAAIAALAAAAAAFLQ